ncbi:DHA2 family efflux MFS transporter permease subunit [Staphylococcus pasteuri]|uniref:DHA2 family efflux MFS transporter permease subunit n=1 Tax=Staphylococcus pasteuri TaxID=45972 RepID=UPI002DB9B106|nr:DHA2 family efflux MFS transporter permease subunit [Staphylococcus pasteuri]MEB6612736.1 DHA2 family efflux MFS transporter permease subunit [Staphylococcus pasteuri]
MTTQVKVKSPKMFAFVLMIGGFMGMFSETALNMALTNVMSDYHVSAVLAQWLTTGYLLTMACMVPVSVYLTKWFSTKKLIISGIILSLIGVVIAAIAPAFSFLLLGRIVQALGTGIILPLMVKVLMLIFPIEKRGVVMGIMGLVMTAGPALGPTIAGIIISSLSWHYIFWISAVLYVVILIIAINKVENVSEITKPKIDILSIILSTIGFSGIIFGLNMMAEQPFMNIVVWGPLLIGILALIVFVRRQFTLKSPMLNLRVFKYGMFNLGALMVFLVILCILGSGIILPIYIKGSLMFSAIMAGLILLPGNIMNLILSPIIGQLFDKFGAKIFGIFGFVILFISMLIFAFTISAHTPVWVIICNFMLMFIGITMIMMPAQTNALNQLPKELYPDGSATITTLIQVAGSAGTTIAITIYTIAMKHFSETHEKISETILIAHGAEKAFWYLVVLAFIGLICSLFVKKPKVDN